MKKKAVVLGEGLLTIWRVLLVIIVAASVLGLSSVFYTYSIDVRNVEAQLMARNVIECLSPNGVINLDAFSESESKHILNYCGFSTHDGRFFVKVDVKTNLAEKVLKDGDEGSLWLVKFFKEKIQGKSKETQLAKPGYFSSSYPIGVYSGGVKSFGEMIVEVLVKDES